MTIFCVKDGDICGVVYNFPLKKVVPRPAPGVVEPRYIATPTKGVVIDRCTGKMETQIPVPEDPWAIAPIPFQQTPSPAQPPVQDTKSEPVPKKFSISWDSLPKNVQVAFLRSTRTATFNFMCDGVRYYKDVLNNWTVEYEKPRRDSIIMDDLYTQNTLTDEERSKLNKYFKQDSRKSDFLAGKFHNP